MHLQIEHPSDRNLSIQLVWEKCRVWARDGGRACSERRCWGRNRNSRTQNGKVGRSEGESRSGRRGEKLLSTAKTGNHSCTRTYTHSYTHARTHTHSCWRYNPACPWIETVQLRCTTPLLHCVLVPVLFSPGVSDSDNTIVCSGLAEHCGHLILALVETIEYCPSERGRRKRLVRESGLFRSLSLSSRCV